MITFLVGIYCLLWGIIGTLGYSMGAMRWRGVKHWKEITFYFFAGAIWPVLLVMMFVNRKK